ncbi:hydrogenase maturation protein [Streptomyces sp. MUM 203J]|uniref:enoyl-CoA hydratase-related protein n=1 Tax=Streptomyces sp. MUM 203J TaxID=2791990 RepID=UPI001F04C05C|nr:enoyl-CoA hydratase-related protein [Streptomyces sp. MUM 203J]MCH0541765.1 hydrogenase maturation protein [Streptomyces sp. MUM 203J]
MNILLVASAFNSLCQRVYAELSDAGHRVGAVLARPGGEDAVRAAVRERRPDLVVAPMLRTALPEDVWARHTCLVVHPGPPGDRGPSSLDWAIDSGAERWAVTVLRAEAGLDAGDIWASVPFDVPPVGKSALYRGESGDAAVAAVLLAVERFAGGGHKPLSQKDPSVDVVWRDAFRQERRRIDWASDPTRTVLRKLRGGDSQPGVLDELCGVEFFLHGGCPEDELRGPAPGTGRGAVPGSLIATRAGAVCRATVDGAVWIPELRARRASGLPSPFRRPAASVLADAVRAGLVPEDLVAGLPEVPAPLELPAHRRTWSDIRYRQRGPAGFLEFGFPGGAMSTAQCRRLLTAYRWALTRPTSVLVLGSGRDFFSNGIHLGVIEAAVGPAEESWANINAMNDLVEAVLRTTDRLVVAALGGNAAAGGVMLALAADEVWCRGGVVLNPHYRRMGLYGSEYWTYSLPRRVGAEAARRLMTEAVPVSAAAAVGMGLADRLVPASPQGFGPEVHRLAAELAGAPGLRARVAAKEAVRHRDEAARPLAAYRSAELARMRRTFFDARAPYHALRSAFVRKAAGGPADPLAGP